MAERHCNNNRLPVPENREFSAATKGHSATQFELLAFLRSYPAGKEDVPFPCLPWSSGALASIAEESSAMLASPLLRTMIPCASALRQDPGRICRMFEVPQCNGGAMLWGVARLGP